MSLAGTATPSPATKRSVSEDTDLAILVVDSKASTPLGPKIVFANEHAAKQTGYDVASLVGSPLGLVYDRTDLRNLIEKLPLIAKRPGFCWMDRTLIQNGGTRRKVHWTIRPSHNDSLPGFTLTFSDKRPSPAKASAPIEIEIASPPPLPTESIEAFHENREESLAMAAGGVAHDFKNALQAIKSNLEMARSTAGSNHQLSTYLLDADLALDDAEVLARQMLAFTRGEQAGTTVFEVNKLVERVSRLCTAGSRVTCHLSVGPAIRPVEGDPNQIYQVLHNLVINACQAMPNGGVLHLTAGSGDFGNDNPYAVAAGSYTVISVRDRGAGIPAEVLPKIFDKNFSTKPDGSGFGLASCQAIIEHHQGAIRAASRVGVGTEFLVFLPIFSGVEPIASQSQSQQTRARDASQGTQAHHMRKESSPSSHLRTTGHTHSAATLVPTACRVLVVEDQPGVLKATKGILNHLGHESLSACTGEEAVHVYRSHLDSAEPVDVVLLDMTLPGGLNGLDVFQELQRIEPEVRVIATSGYFDEDPGEKILGAGFTGLLAKPFSMSNLSAAIEDALDY